MRTGAIAAALALICAGMALAPAGASAAGRHPKLTAEVTFTVKGTYHVDFVYSTSIDDHATLTLTPQAQFTSWLEFDEDGNATLANAWGALIGSPGSFHQTESYDGGLSTGSCDGTLPLSPDAPLPYVSSQRTAGGLRVSVQSLTRASVAAADYTCPRQTDDLGMSPESYLAWPLNVSTPLPDALTAHLTIPDSALVAGTTYRAKVSSGAVAAACQIAEPLPGCSQSLRWNGTVTIAFGTQCAKRSADDPALPWCVDKAAARKAVSKYRDRIKRDLTVERSACPRKRGRWTCAIFDIKSFYDVHLLKNAVAEANDPPDAAYATVAAPRATRIPKLRRLSRRAPAFAQLARRYGRILGLQQAVLIAQNRSTGASQALDQDSSAKAALGRQKQAILHDAAQAARLLRGQAAYARKAAHELLGVASAERDHALAAGVRRLAHSLTSRATRRGDRLTTGWLAGIGR